MRKIYCALLICAASTTSLSVAKDVVPEDTSYKDLVTVLLDNSDELRAIQRNPGRQKTKHQVVVRNSASLSQNTLLRITEAAKQLPTADPSRFRSALNHSKIQLDSARKGYAYSKSSIYSVRVDDEGDCEFSVSVMLIFNLAEGQWMASPFKSSEHWHLSRNGKLKRTKSVESWMVAHL